MKNIEKRIATLTLLIKASPAFTDPTVKAAVLDELNEMRNSGRIAPPRRKRLLTVIHLARCLETSLRTVVENNAIQLEAKERNMGGYMKALASQALLTDQIRRACIRDVKHLRNDIAHGAGRYPLNDQAVDAASQAAHSCLSLILR